MQLDSRYLCRNVLSHDSPKRACDSGTICDPRADPSFPTQKQSDGPHDQTVKKNKDAGPCSDMLHSPAALHSPTFRLEQVESERRHFQEQMHVVQQELENKLRASQKELELMQSALEQVISSFAPLLHVPRTRFYLSVCWRLFLHPKRWLASVAASEPRRVRKPALMHARTQGREGCSDGESRSSGRQ